MPNRPRVSEVKHRIAVIQMVSSTDVETNLERVDDLVARAASRDVEAVFLPENFAAFAHQDIRKVAFAETGTDGTVRQTMSRLAKRYHCWIFAGTIPMITRPDGSRVDEPRVRAASLVFDNEGLEVARYDKMHLFDVQVEDNQKKYSESMSFEAGDELVCTHSPIGLIGLTVCYDVRFPELYSRLRDQEVRSFAVPSAFTTVTGKAHFEILMRCRAVENFSWVIAACQGGRHDSGRETWGHSMVVSPWGEKIVEAGTGEDILVATIDLEEQDRIRADMPVHRQKRLEAGFRNLSPDCRSSRKGS